MDRLRLSNGTLELVWEPDVVIIFGQKVELEKNKKYGKLSHV